MVDLHIFLSMAMIVSESVSLFMAEVRATREPTTAKSYSSRFTGLIRMHGDRDVKSLTADDLQLWLTTDQKFVDGRDKKPDTIRLTMIASDLWQAWLVKEKHVDAIILGKQRKPAGRIREVLPTSEEIKLIIDNCPDDLKTAIRVLRLTGMRPSEFSRARIEDLNTRTWLIVLEKHKTAKKTGRPRKIAVGHPALVELVNDAIGDRKSGLIFLRANGKPWTTESLSAGFRQARRAAGIPDSAGLVLYLTRHEHGTQIYESTGDIAAVMYALGHSNPQMSTRYAKATPDLLKKNQKLFNEGLG